jgi:membrane-associated protease RseP (regulator of RpoE activity)
LRRRLEVALAVLGFGGAAGLAWFAFTPEEAVTVVPVEAPVASAPAPRGPAEPAPRPVAAPALVPAPLAPAPPPEEAPRRREPEQGPRGTLGVAWSFTGRGPEVEAVTEGSPAARAGVQVGDVVVEVDGSAVVNIEQATKAMLRGAGPAARLKVQRGKDFLLLDVPRDWEQ